ncbi:histone-lysine N-methyltransferase EZA1 [Impatiens glandulifera]|uniref:histone-lysine N-methyltransferase EZA1 n=1 Tax=Impatiens glandulifera TaxID=253017 RepID=UPI001FB18F6B|nr:histone-lysine N-methyltransferase EZA1 [Impatiens glandulifera]
MVSKSTDSSSRQRRLHEEDEMDTLDTLPSKINHLKKKIQSERAVSVKDKIEANRLNLEACVSQLKTLATSRNTVSISEESYKSTTLGVGFQSHLCKLSGHPQGYGDKDYVSSHEIFYSTSTRLPRVVKIPPYTSWVFLDKNQRMAEDQSVVDRLNIYYGSQGGEEALICSDSDEEIVEPEEEKHEFSEGEDRIIWMAFEEHGLSEDVNNIVSKYISGTTLQIQERYDLLKNKYQGNQEMEPEEERKTILDKSLSASMDSLDNLFCRRCMVFDCRLHGCSQTLIYSSDNLLYSSDSGDNGKPCSDQCYLKLRVVEDLDMKSLHGNETRSSDEGSTSITTNPERQEKYNISKSTNVLPEDLTVVSDYSNSLFMKRRIFLSETSSITRAEDLENNTHKKDELLKPIQNPVNSINIASDKSDPRYGVPRFEILESIADDTISTIQTSKMLDVKQLSDPAKAQVDGTFRSCEWKPLEKELYLQGLKAFGSNSCLVARNTLLGLKTCTEVYNYMYDDGAAMTHGAHSGLNPYAHDHGRSDADYMDPETRPRVFRRRGRARKLKYTSKSAGHPSMWKRIANGKNQSCKQYTPCVCQSMCGKDCACQINGTCCEKYCGCSKICKNRFRGCHCAKSQCRSRQCPCFAAGRECDPDVCRHCWISCGDGSLGEPPRRGEGQCGNMRLLLRQQQRILLAKSDVTGWGAFSRNAVNKNDYLGEYTGELISHGEADKRGKMYDLVNLSFLFDLNDQYVLDAYRKGDKLKFANHSSKPNCYAKVMMVAGDHRVGIFAKDNIEACDELFYDYQYGPDEAPVWARKPDGAKGNDSSNSLIKGQAKKHQSH